LPEDVEIWGFGNVEEWLDGYIAKLLEGVSNVTIQQFGNLPVFQL